MIRKIINRIKKWKKDREHDRELYVLNNGFAFVKCKKCGAESIPWRVAIKQAQEHNERHPDSLNELFKIDENRDSEAKCSGR